jgi:hypothetical protein
MSTSQSISQQEQVFLQAHQARTNAIADRQDRPKATDDLYAFWKILRSKFADWQRRLTALSETKEGSKDRLNVNVNVRQELTNLKLELDQLRKHVLTGGVVVSSAYDDLQVPDLPLADVRLLQSEFMACSQKWETVTDELIPKGKFVFKRYRDAIFSRRGCINSSNNNNKVSPDLSAVDTARSSHRVERFNTNNEGNILKDLLNSTICIHANGEVTIQDGDKLETEAKLDFQKASSLLIRNLHNCTLKM